MILQQLINLTPKDILMEQARGILVLMVLGVSYSFPRIIMSLSMHFWADVLIIGLNCMHS